MFELDLHQFENSGGLLSNGLSCGSDCRTYFSVCLKNFQTVVSPGDCIFGRVITPVLGHDSFSLTEPRGRLRLPLLNFTWPVRKSLNITLKYDECSKYYVLAIWNCRVTEMSELCNLVEMIFSTRKCSFLKRHKPTHFGITFGQLFDVVCVLLFSLQGAFSLLIEAWHAPASDLPGGELFSTARGRCGRGCDQALVGYNVFNLL